MAEVRTGSKRRRIALGVVAVAVIAVAALVLYQYQQSNGTKGTLVTLNGQSYWSTTVPVEYNLTSLTFRGVKFDFAYGFSLEGSWGPYTHITHSTQVTAPCPPGVAGGASLCSQFLPQVQVSFSDGSAEYFNRAAAANTTLTFHPPSSYPWFSTHTSPQVAIMLNTNAPTASLTLYVSA